MKFFNKEEYQIRNNTLSIATTISFRNWGEFFSSPIISGIAQSNPITAVISAFVVSAYQQQQYEAMQDFLQRIHNKTRNLEEKMIDREFLLSKDGQRIIGKAMRSVIRDNRKEKIEAMSNLTINLFLNKKISLDEKELYVDVLDALNSLQLSILERGVVDMRARKGYMHRGLGAEPIGSEYEKIGISKPLFMQSLRALESHGLLNNNAASMRELDQTYFISNFGEQFYDYISEILLKEIQTAKNKEL